MAALRARNRSTQRSRRTMINASVERLQLFRELVVLCLQARSLRPLTGNNFGFRFADELLIAQLGFRSTQLTFDPTEFLAQPIALFRNIDQSFQRNEQLAAR